MKQSVHPKVLMLATLFLAVLASAVGVFGLSERQHILARGKKTTGVVVGIDVGVKGTRSIEARFETLDGQVVMGRDIHKSQWLNANEVGDRVTLYYDPQEPEKILIHRGFWMWSNPFHPGAFACASIIGESWFSILRTLSRAGNNGRSVAAHRCHESPTLD